MEFAAAASLGFADSLGLAVRLEVGPSSNMAMVIACKLAANSEERTNSASSSSTHRCSDCQIVAVIAACHAAPSSAIFSAPSPSASIR